MRLHRKEVGTTLRDSTAELYEAEAVRVLAYTYAEIGVTPSVPALASVSAFPDVNHGWASDGTRLYRTRDGGQHWTKLSPGVNLQHISSLDFVSSDIGWAIGSTATNCPAFFKTVDEGHTWTVIPSSIS